MARTYRRDSRGRFAGGGGSGGSASGRSSRGSSTTGVGGGASQSRRRSTSPVAPVPPTSLRFQTGERLKAGLKKATASQLQTLDNSAISRTLKNAIFNEKSRRSGLTKGSKVGAGLGGKRKVLSASASKRSMAIGKAAAEAHNKRVGAKQGTPEANKIGVKASVEFNRRRRISKAAQKAGLGGKKTKGR